MTPTYILIASQTLGSSASSVTFSSIPATYRDLIIVVTCSDSSGSSVRMRLNSDTGSNYSYVAMMGNGTTPNSETSSGSSGTIASFAATSATLSTYITHLNDYSATDKHKSWLSRGSNSLRAVEAIAGRWANTAAVNTIQITATSFDAGSRFYLYGIAS